MGPLTMSISVAMKAEKGKKSKVRSPLCLLAIMLVVLFFAEAIVMFTLPRFFHTSNVFVDNFADSVMLILISARGYTGLTILRNTPPGLS